MLINYNKLTETAVTIINFFGAYYIGGSLENSAIFLSN